MKKLQYPKQTLIVVGVLLILLLIVWFLGTAGATGDKLVAGMVEAVKDENEQLRKDIEKIKEIGDKLEALEKRVKELEDNRIIIKSGTSSEYQMPPFEILQENID